MPQLYYSNRLEILADALIGHCRETDPFETTDLIVPNFNLQKWLSLQISHREGILANVRFSTMEERLAQVLAAGMPQGHQVRLLSVPQLQRLIMEVIRQHCKTAQTKSWDRLIFYIQRHGKAGKVEQQQRLFQVAGHLAKLFREYGYARPEMLMAWKQGQSCFHNEAAQTEAWQMEIWNQIFNPEQGFLRSPQDQAAESETEFLTLEQIAQQTDWQRLKASQPLHLFGISYISAFHQDLLTQLDRFRPVLIYTLNPCLEYWEDVPSDFELSRLKAKSLLKYRDQPISQLELEAGTLVDNLEDNPLLRAWGRPGRENIRLMNERSDWDFQAAYHSHQPHQQGDQTTVLAQVQQDVLMRESKRPDPLGLPVDETLQVLAAPSLKREVEVVACELVNLLKQQAGSLSMADVALFVSDMQVYQPLIESTFHRMGNLPYNLIDGVLKTGSTLVRCVLALLELAKSDFTRQDLFVLLSHPNFLKKHDCTLEDCEQWLEWADETAVYYGIDSDHQWRLGVFHLSEPRHHWQQGLNRLALGMVMAQQHPTQPETVQNATHQWLPLSVPDSDQENARQFHTLVQSLINDTRHAVDWELSAGQWGEWMNRLLSTYLNPLTPQEEIEFNRLQQTLLSLGELDAPCPPALRDSLSYLEVLQFVQDKVDRITVKKGRYLADGVTVSSFLPMRPIPFKVVFILGLSEERFPKSERRDNLDLRQSRVDFPHPVLDLSFRERQLGDVSENEQQKYMFLETLISTRQRLVLSYVARNEQSGEAVNPSSIITTLVNYCEQQLFAPGTQMPFKESPLNRYSWEMDSTGGGHDSHVERFNSLSMDPLANQEASHYWLYQQLENHLLQQHEARLASREVRLQWLRQISGQSPPAASEAVQAESRPILITNRQLVRFLECPLQGGTEFRLKLKDDDQGDLRAATEDPLESESRVESMLLQRVIQRSLGQPQAMLSDLYEDESRTLSLSGHLPAGHFQQWQQQRHLQVLTTWQQQVLKAMQWNDWAEFTRTYFKFRFGASRYGGQNDSHTEVLPALPFELEEGPQKLELGGTSQLWLECPKDEWVVLKFSLSKSKAPHRQVFSAFLDTLMLSHSGRLQPSAKVLSVCVSDYTVLPLLNPINVPDAGQAGQDLRSLAKEMLFAPNGSLLPCEAVLAAAQKGGLSHAKAFDEQFVNFVQQALDSPFAKISSRYGPVSDWNRYPIETKAWEIVQQRFGLMLKCVDLSQ